MSSTGGCQAHEYLLTFDNGGFAIFLCFKIFPDSIPKTSVRRCTSKETSLCKIKDGVKLCMAIVNLIIYCVKRQ